MTNGRQNWLGRLLNSDRSPDATVPFPVPTVIDNRTQPSPGHAGAGDWEPDQILLDDFLVERVLGEGGLGKVFLVRSKTSPTSFAVKRLRVASETARRNFLAELQTWIDLPEHPHLTACRFFRTLGDEVLIFAEYVEGGTLHEWIRDHKLTRLEEILDVAIQCAWGLHVAHECGVVHQDMKPGNVLMTPDGVARLCDFGTARARERAGETSEDPTRSRLVSCGGLTPGYCSPEQKARQPLDRRTDIWSWGVSVLEMFYGEPPCLNAGGEHATEVLEAYLEAGQLVYDPGLPVVPGGVVEILRTCFQPDPTDRWRYSADMVARLKDEYRKACGTEYSRNLPVAARKSGGHVQREPRLREEGRWHDPRKWLEQALREEGKDPQELETLLPREAMGPRGQLVGELAAYDEARRRFEQLVRQGRKDLEGLLAALCVDKAMVHVAATDMPGAFEEYDRAIELYERLVQQGGQRESGDLARAYGNKANAMRAFRHHREALELYDRVIEILERLADAGGRAQLANDLAIAYTNKAIAVDAMRRHSDAVELYDRAIAIRERLVHTEGRGELANDLAIAYTNKALAVSALGDHRTAVKLYDSAILIREQLVREGGHPELANDLAIAYMNKAVAVSELGNMEAAVGLYDQAIAIWQRLVYAEGRRELADDLAIAYTDKAIAVSALGDKQAAVQLYDRAIEIHERLVRQEGRRELADDLASAYMNKAIAQSDLGLHGQAVKLYDLAIQIQERLVHEEGRLELAEDLAKTYANKALAESTAGNDQAAERLRGQANEIRARLVHQGDRRGAAEIVLRGYARLGKASEWGVWDTEDRREDCV